MNVALANLWLQRLFGAKLSLVRDQGHHPSGPSQRLFAVPVAAVGLPHGPIRCSTRVKYVPRDILVSVSACVLCLFSRVCAVCLCVHAFCTLACIAVTGLFVVSTVGTAIMAFDTSIPVIVPLVMFGLGYSCIPGSLWCVRRCAELRVSGCLPLLWSKLLFCLLGVFSQRQLCQQLPTCGVRDSVRPVVTHPSCAACVGATATPVVAHPFCATFVGATVRPLVIHPSCAASVRPVVTHMLPCHCVCSAFLVCALECAECPWWLHPCSYGLSTCACNMCMAGGQFFVGKLTHIQENDVWPYQYSWLVITGGLCWMCICGRFADLPA